LSLEQDTDLKVIGANGGSEFLRLAPVGYYIALRVGFAFPVAEYNLLPLPWVEHYTRNSYMPADPVMHWLYQNTGAIRWSAIKLPDPRGILAEAANFGLRFGVAVSCEDVGPGGQRSFGNFLRADREFDDDEIAALKDRLQSMHAAMAPPTNLTVAELEALRMVENGLLVKEIANALGVTDGAIKLRLKGAKAKLRAKTGSQAVSMARSFRLI
jgi:LuxR family transcriptional regulator, quorum-sensing system regulator SdiA